MAVLAVETGIAPNDLLESSPEMLDAMFDWLKRQAEEQRKAVKRHG